MKEQRELWSESDYFLINIGCAIGFGCVWRFPYLLYENGGAAFFIPYMTCLFLLVYPLAYLEIGVGLHFQKPLQTCYQSVHRKFGGNVKLIFLTCSLISCFYIILLVYCLIYIFDALFSDLPFLREPKESVI